MFRLCRTHEVVSSPVKYGCVGLEKPYLWFLEILEYLFRWHMTHFDCAPGGRGVPDAGYPLADDLVPYHDRSGLSRAVSRRSGDGAVERPGNQPSGFRGCGFHHRHQPGGPALLPCRRVAAVEVQPATPLESNVFAGSPSYRSIGAGLKQGEVNLCASNGVEIVGEDVQGDVGDD